MTGDEQALEWIAQIRAGNSEGARRLWDQFASRMAAVARACLRGWAGRAFADEDDAVQVAFAGLCQQLGRGDYPRLGSPAVVWRLLHAVVRRAATRLVRDQRRLKRGGGARPADNDTLNRLPGQGATPARNAEAHEEFLLILDRLAVGGRRLWQVAVWKTRGLTNQEIAGRLGCGVATVERRLGAIRQALASRVPA